jgi:hypothetical protein
MQTFGTFASDARSSKSTGIAHAPCRLPAPMAGQYAAWTFSTFDLRGPWTGAYIYTCILPPLPPSPRHNSLRIRTLTMTKTKSDIATTHNSIDVGTWVAETLRRMGPDGRSQFLDKFDEVRQRLPLWRNPRPITSSKECPILDLEHSQYTTVLGGIYSALQQLPTSVELSGRLVKCGKICVASGGFTDVWRGNLSSNSGESLVAIKAFRLCAQNVGEAKKVSKKSTNKVRSRAKFTDSLETDTVVEETIP